MNNEETIQAYVELEEKVISFIKDKADKSELITTASTAASIIISKFLKTSKNELKNLNNEKELILVKKIKDSKKELRAAARAKNKDARIKQIHFSSVLETINDLSFVQIVFLNEKYDLKLITGKELFEKKKMSICLHPNLNSDIEDFALVLNKDKKIKARKLITVALVDFYNNSFDINKEFKTYSTEYKN
jgi:hypothetical protein